MTDDHPKLIRRGELLGKLARAAQVRSVLSLLSAFPAVLVAGLLTAALQNNGPNDAVGVLALMAFFGVPFGVSMLLTKYYCRRAVVCPCCQASLWDCGTGNFKPRRMRIRADATACPHCRAPIV